MTRAVARPTGPAIAAAPRLALRLLAGVNPDPAGNPLSLTEHRRVHGPRPRCSARSAGRYALTPDSLIAAARACGLRGRGGGRYPLAAKLAAVAGQRGRPLVVLNGAEGEPASRKDAALLGRSPHLALDGAALAAEAVGGCEVVVWLVREPGAPIRQVRAAVAERAAAGIDRVTFRVEVGPPRYVSGNTSSVVNHLSGGPALPRFGAHAAVHGVHGRPTLVSNAETLAHLALLARRGVPWYRSVGDPDEPGTMLVTLAGAVRHQVVAEVPTGTPIGTVVAAAAPLGMPQAVLVGGYGGGWLPWPDAAAVPLTTAALRRAGGSIGAGLVAVLPAERCGLAETAHLAGWLAGETAGQCGPCVNGLPALAGTLRALAAGGAGADAVQRLHRWAGMVTRRGLCSHPDGVAFLVRSALRVFDREVAAHGHGWCSALDRRPLLPTPQHCDPQVTR